MIKMINAFSMAAALLFVLFSSPALQAAETGVAAVKYFKSPLLFEPNEGQSAPNVDFISRAKDFRLYLSRTETLIELPQESVRMQLVGANRSARPVPLDLSETKINYYIGSDPAQWRSGISTYGRAKFRDIYSGIDIVYYGNGEQLEYDFVVAPGAEPREIALRFPEARRLRVDSNGDLLVTAGYGTLRFQKPSVFQELDGGRRPVAGRYIVSNRLVSFKVGAYDRNRPLVIDPTLLWSAYIGGTNFEQAYGVTADSDSNVYVTGVTKSIDFPTQSAYQSTPGSAPGTIVDAFITKLDSRGRIVFSTYFGGDRGDQGNGIAIDSLRNVYVAGWTASTSGFPGSPTCAGCGSTDAFVAKLSASGGTLLYSKRIGGLGSDQANGIAVDVAGNAYITGFTDSDNFPDSVGTLDANGADAFLVKLDPTGSTILFSKLIGGSETDGGNAVSLDLSGNVYVTGFISKSAPFFDTDVFVSKFSSTGILLYSTVRAGSAGDMGNAIAVDKLGNAWVVGTTESADFDTAGTGLRGFSGVQDAFIMRADPLGVVDYVTFLGGSDLDVGTGVGIDPQGTVSIGGTTASPDFPTVNPLSGLGALNGVQDAFIARLNPMVNPPTLVYSTYFGGSRDDFGVGLAVAPTADPTINNTIIAGYSESFDLPMKTKAKAGEGRAAFAAMITDGVPPPPPPPPGTVALFANFVCKVDIDIHEKPKAGPNDDTFNLDCDFSLGSGSNGISPVSELTTLSVGSVTIILPPNSFKDKGKKKEGPFQYKGTMSGIKLDIQIKPQGGPAYRITAEGKNANMSGTTNPVPVQLTIGDDTSGPKTFTAKIH
jgi:hypothetical protein